MTLMFRRIPAVVAAAVMVAVAIAPGSVAAQQAARTGAPVKGTWGGEASVGGDGQGASLLRFQSPQWALLVGGSIRSTTGAGFTGGARERYTAAGLRIGARRYGGSGLGVRPLLGLGVNIFGATGQSNELGAYGEAGAAYFFNPHLSVGATAELSAAGREGGGSSFGASLARLTAAVFF
jgi:hypothetical protein